MIHRAPSRGSCIDTRAAGDCEPAAQVQRRRDALPPVPFDRKLELALAGDRETNCRLEYAVTVSFFHEERVRLRDLAEAADGPAARARGAEVSVGWRAGRARAGRRSHRDGDVEAECAGRPSRCERRQRRAGQRDPDRGPVEALFHSTPYSVSGAKWERSSAPRWAGEGRPPPHRLNRRLSTVTLCVMGRRSAAYS